MAKRESPPKEKGSTLNRHLHLPPVRPIFSNLMQPVPGTIGLIAGNRSLPLELARQIRSDGQSRVVAVAFEGETDPQLAGVVDEIVWLRVGQLSKMISAFTSRGVKQCVMAGQIAPKNLYDVRPDLRAAALLFRLKRKNAHTVFGAI